MTAPLNDNIADAELIDLSLGTFTSDAVDNTEATLETFETADTTTFPDSSSVWWRIDVAEDVLLDFDPSGTAETPFTFQVFIGPATDDLTELLRLSTGTAPTQAIDGGSILWIRFASATVPSTYNFTVTPTAPVTTGQILADPLSFDGEEGSMDLEFAGATLESGEDAPSGVIGTLWGEWAPPGEDISRERFRITQGSATLRVYSYDAVTDTRTLIVESTADPADVIITDLDVTLSDDLDYQVQVGVRSGDPTDVTIEWFSGDPSDYDDFLDALEIDPVYGSQELSLLNNTLETGEPTPSGVEATGWMFFTAEETQNLNFDISADLELPYTVQVFSGTALDSLTLVSTTSSVAGEDLVIIVAMTQDVTYYLQFSAADDFMNFDVQWSIDPTIEDPYFETDGGDEDMLEDTEPDTEADTGTTYASGYTTDEPDEAVWFSDDEGEF